MELFHVNAGLQIQLLDNVAQVLLRPQQALCTFTDYIVCASEGLSLLKKSLWIKLKTARLQPVSLTGKNDRVDYVTIGKPKGGPILVLSPHILEADLIVQEADLLAQYELKATQHMKNWRSLENYITLSGSGAALLQRSSPIIEKRLAEGEMIYVLSKALVAFSATAKVQDVSPASFNWRLLPQKWRLLAISGPGFVYMCAEEQSEAPKGEITSADARAIATLIGIILALFTLERFMNFVLPALEKT